MRAEASLQELLAGVDSTGSDVRPMFHHDVIHLVYHPSSIYQSSAEFQEVRWWQLEILKRRGASDEALYDGKHSFLALGDIFD